MEVAVTVLHEVLQYVHCKQYLTALLIQENLLQHDYALLGNLHRGVDELDDVQHHVHLHLLGSE
mgnify:CR=1 FL=1